MSANLHPSSKHILYDVPVSNNGARCRIILYKKGISEEEVKICSPMELGGLRSAEYLSISPQGKMPVITIAEPTNNSDNDGLASIPESDTISRYLLEKYATVGPSFLPNNARSNLIIRYHDLYMTSIQGCMYKAAPPFGQYSTRRDALLEYCKQLSIISDLIEGSSTYLCGDEVSLADATLFPSLVFATHMLPKFVISSNEEEQAKISIPEKLSDYYERVIAEDETFSKVHQEMTSALEGWEGKNRWDNILLAGLRDEAPATIFDSIIRSEIPATVVRDDPKYMAFKDINPAAPTHILIIPKQRDNLTHLHKATADHTQILGTLLVAAAEMVNDPTLGFDEGARIVINDGASAGQEVFHLHIHLLGGREMNWPPG